MEYLASWVFLLNILAHKKKLGTPFLDPFYVDVIVTLTPFLYFKDGQDIFSLKQEKVFLIELKTTFSFLIFKAVLLWKLRFFLAITTLRTFSVSSTSVLLYSWTFVRLDFCTFVLLYICTFVRLYFSIFVTLPMKINLENLLIFLFYCHFILINWLRLMYLWNSYKNA